MFYVNFDAVFLMYVLCQMLGRIDASVLSASTPEREHQACKTSFNITLYMGIGKFIYTLQECQNLAIIFEEANYWFIKTCELLIWLIASWIVGRAAIEDISATIARSIFWYSLAI